MKTFFYSQWIQNQKSIIITRFDNQLLIKGPLGSLFLDLPKQIIFEQNNQGYRLFGISKEKNLVLTYFKLLQNSLRGVNIGFSETLVINGVGWRVLLVDKVLTFSLGFSHLVTYSLPMNIEVIIYDKQCFKIFGLQSQHVQQVIADLCKLRIFNVYKGKGIYKQGKIFDLKESSKSKA